ncbi:IS66 Orf2 family protein [Pseudomonas syringae pv. actinidiae ICMP 18801]|nr:IS66 Orf2 family protein [Pseudomonas syringae pv. actinidiae ICMP 18801]
MMRPDAKVEKVYLYPKPVDFRKSIDGLAALVELDIKVASATASAFGSSAWSPSGSKPLPMRRTRPSC